jgi:hypothetical protein
MNKNAIELEAWMENEGICHIGNFKYLYKNNLYTMPQLIALFRELRLVDRRLK